MFSIPSVVSLTPWLLVGFVTLIRGGLLDCAAAIDHGLSEEDRSEQCHGRIRPLSASSSNHIKLDEWRENDIGTTRDATKHSRVRSGKDLTWQRTPGIPITSPRLTRGCWFMEMDDNNRSCPVVIREKCSSCDSPGSVLRSIGLGQRFHASDKGNVWDSNKMSHDSLKIPFSQLKMSAAWSGWFGQNYLSSS